MICQPYPINIGKQWNVSRTKGLEGDRHLVGLNHVEDMMVEHVRSNEVIPESQTPLVVVPDVTIESPELLGWFVVHSPVLLVPRHHVGSSSGRSP